MGSNLYNSVCILNKNAFRLLPVSPRVVTWCTWSGGGVPGPRGVPGLGGCWILDMFEWNKLRCTYVHFNNLFHTLKNLYYIVVHAVQVDDDLGMRHDIWNLHWFIYTHLNRQEKGWEVLWSQLTCKRWIELQLYEKLSLVRTNVWIAIPMFSSCLTPWSVN